VQKHKIAKFIQNGNFAEMNKIETFSKNGNLAEFTKSSKNVAEHFTE